MLALIVWAPWPHLRGHGTFSGSSTCPRQAWESSPVPIDRRWSLWHYCGGLL